MKVLVVEDEFLIATDIVDALVDAGHEALGPFAAPSKALRALEAVVPDIAVLDFDLVGGLTSAPVARRLDSLGVPFVFLTGRRREEAALLSSFGAAPKLDKPVRPRDLLRVIERLCA